MNVEIQINNSTSPLARFVGWSPSPCRARVTDPAGITGATVTVKISSASSPGAGALVFGDTASGPYTATRNLTLPADGTSVSFFAAGKFGRPSADPDDVTIEARSGTTLVGSVVSMVRVRQNANDLSTSLRDAFLNAMATLNDRGLGRFADFRNMHTDATNDEMHQRPGFLPWHRAYLLDLERELQAIDPVVTIPYWKFDAVAPNIFKQDFMGTTDPADFTGAVQFSATNSLRFWKTDGVPGVFRRPLFDPATEAASDGVSPVLDEADTLALGPNYRQFRGMEGDPHGAAHTSFGGMISSIGTAVRDPLFFLLHSNVDRLWAKWQRAKPSRLDATAAGAFYAPPGGNRIGHNLPDTMWPWNGVTTPPRPSIAPGGGFAPAVDPILTAPGLTPRVQDVLDYQGSLGAAAKLGVDYDDVPYF